MQLFPLNKRLFSNSNASIFERLINGDNTESFRLVTERIATNTAITWPLIIVTDVLNIISDIALQPL